MQVLSLSWGCRGGLLKCWVLSLYIYLAPELGERKIRHKSSYDKMFSDVTKGVAMKVFFQWWCCAYIFVLQILCHDLYIYIYILSLSPCPMQCHHCTVLCVCVCVHASAHGPFSPTIFLFFFFLGRISKDTVVKGSVWTVEEGQICFWYCYHHLRFIYFAKFNHFQ